MSAEGKEPTRIYGLIEAVMQDLERIGDGPITPTVAEDLHCTEEDAEALLRAVALGTINLQRGPEIALISAFVIGVKIGQKVARADALETDRVWREATE